MLHGLGELPGLLDVCVLLVLLVLPVLTVLLLSDGFEAASGVWTGSVALLGLLLLLFSPWYLVLELVLVAVFEVEPELEEGLVEPGNTGAKELTVVELLTVRLLGGGGGLLLWLGGGELLLDEEGIELLDWELVLTGGVLVLTGEVDVLELTEGGGDSVLTGEGDCVLAGGVSVLTGGEGVLILPEGGVQG